MTKKETFNRLTLQERFDPSEAYLEEGHLDLDAIARSHPETENRVLDLSHEVALHERLADYLESRLDEKGIKSALGRSATSDTLHLDNAPRTNYMMLEEARRLEAEERGGPSR